MHVGLLVKTGGKPTTHFAVHESVSEINRYTVANHRWTLKEVILDHSLIIMHVIYVAICGLKN
jgi:hypothetical protein